MTESRNSFSGSLGFVLASAGSAVGLGNIWRFPYLAARDGGGLFLVLYILLAVTFGFTLLITEVAIGRRSRQGPLTAYILPREMGIHRLYLVHSALYHLSLLLRNRWLGAEISHYIYHSECRCTSSRRIFHRFHHRSVVSHRLYGSVCHTLLLCGI